MPVIQFAVARRAARKAKREGSLIQYYPAIDADPNSVYI
jgi:hypothetical protein